MSTTKSEYSKLLLIHALSFASHLVKTEDFRGSSNPRIDKIATLFDYAELIQEEYENRIKNQS